MSKNEHKVPKLENRDSKIIDLNILALFLMIWRKKMLVVKITSLFSILGLLNAIYGPIIYTASTTFLPKSSIGKKSSAGLSGLASLAGITLSSGIGSENEISPSLYPLIGSSQPFLEEILNIKFIHYNKEISLKNYLENENNSPFSDKIKKYTIRIPGQIKEFFLQKITADSKSENTNYDLISLTLEEEKIMNGLKSKLVIEVDLEIGIISLSFEDSNREICAFIASKAREKLQQKIINLQIKSAQESLIYTEKLFVKKKNEFEFLQDSIAAFKDQNQNINSRLFRNKLSRLESQFAISKAVTEELAKQVEQARLKVSRDTPIFTIIEPVVIPNLRTSPKRTLTVVIYSFLGLIIGIAYALLKKPIKHLTNSITSTDANKWINP